MELEGEGPHAALQSVSPACTLPSSSSNVQGILALPPCTEHFPSSLKGCKKLKHSAEAPFYPALTDSKQAAELWPTWSSRALKTRPMVANSSLSCFIYWEMSMGQRQVLISRLLSLDSHLELRVGCYPMHFHTNPLLTRASVWNWPGLCSLLWL